VGEVYAVYVPNATSTGSLSLPSGNYEQRWFNPRSGAFEGTAQSVVGGSSVALGPPPSGTTADWVALLRQT